MHEPIGIMTALPEEAGSLLDLAEITGEAEHGRRRFVRARLFGREVIVVQSRIGKVAAATTATELVGRFGVASLLFTGVAGALDPRLRVGDIVVASELAQHDLDASPLFPPMEVPLLGRSHFPADPAIADRLAAAAERVAAGGASEILGSDNADALGIDLPRVHRGLIISGDRFVSSDREVAALRARLPEALAVEMEGAAVAQVAYEHGLPLGVVRFISDAADDHAAAHFPQALGILAGAYAVAMIRELLAPSSTPAPG